MPFEVHGVPDFAALQEVDSGPRGDRSSDVPQRAPSGADGTLATDRRTSHRRQSRRILDESSSNSRLKFLSRVFDYPHPLAVPMKFYDYLQSGGELLLFSRPGSALALAAGKGDRTVVEPEDAAGAVSVLHRAWGKWSQHRFPAHQDSRGIYHRRERVAEVDALLRELTGAERA